ncbi:MAG: trigger factor [Sphingomonadaceae bacterium]
MQTVETLNEGLKRAYTLTIPAEEIDARIDKEIRDVAPQVRMPGFRPGKVPPNLIRKMHGEKLHSEALSNAVQEGVQQLLAEQRLRPATQPSVELEGGAAPGEDMVVKVELETLPEVPAPQVEEIVLERLVIPVDDKAVDEALAKLAENQQSFEPAPKSHAARKGDLVTIDYRGTVEGEEFEGGKAEGMAVELGSKRLVPGFEDQLVGAKVNEERTVAVTFPEDYPVAYLKGREAKFEVLVAEVQKPRPVEPDDEFAQSMGLDGIDQLRELIKKQLEDEYAGLTRTHMRRKLLDQLSTRHKFPVPETMVEAEFEQIWTQLQQEADKEEDPKAARAELEAEKDDYRVIAERRVRLGLLLSEIGQANGVDISQAEMNQLVQQAAQRYRPEDRERFVQYVRSTPMAAAQLRAPLYEDKVVNFLFENAEIKEREVTREELEAEIEDETIEGVEEGGARTPARRSAKKPAARKASAGRPAAKKRGEKKSAAKTGAKKAAAKKGGAKGAGKAGAKKAGAEKAPPAGRAAKKTARKS